MNRKMNLLDKKILHVKIPKNGTHSINKVLIDKDCWKRNYFFGHDPLYVLEENNSIDENVFVFCISRNPFTRFYSQYNQLIRTQPNYYNKSIFDFVDDIKNKKLHPLFVSPQVEWISNRYKNILPTKCTFENLQNSIFSPYTNPSKSINLSKKINKIYKLENMIDFEIDFELKLNYYNYSKYSLKQYKNSFNEEIINFIIDYYDKDFYAFNYKKNFNESIKELNLMRKKLFYYN
jgi:hypothetical protein